MLQANTINRKRFEFDLHLQVIIQSLIHSKTY